MGDAGADLSDPRLAVGDAGVDHRHDPAVEHPADVDAGNGGGEIQRRQGETRVGGQGQTVHLAALRQRIGG